METTRVYEDCWHGVTSEDVAALGMDDSAFRDMPYYPRDLL